MTRLDVELALQTGSPHFFRGMLAQTAITESAISPHVRERFHHTPWALLSVVSDIYEFARLLNRVAVQLSAKLDPIHYTKTLVLLTYRLLELAPLGQLDTRFGTISDRVVHLAMLAFMTVAGLHSSESKPISLRSFGDESGRTLEVLRRN